MHLDERLGNVDKIVKVLRMYGQLSIKQGMKILGLNESDTTSNFKTAIRQKLAVGCGTDAIVINGLKVLNYNKKLEKAMDLMIELSLNNEEINFYESLHEKDNEPYMIFFPTKDDVYDILYIEEGKEKMYNNKMKRLNADSNFLVIVENESQLEELNFNGIKGFYLATDGGLKTVERD